MRCRSIITSNFYRHSLLLVGFIFISALSSAQYYTNQNKVWVFGDSLKFDFNATPPTLSSINFNTYEGSASVADVAGDLLFYTNGECVYNRFGDTMPSGIGFIPYFTSSASQSSVIVPQPGNPENYFLFSLEHYMGWGRLSYSVVDMTLDSGRGDIDTNMMGVRIDSNLTEHLISVPGNNCNFWVIVHDRSWSRFKAYEVTATGVDTTPVESLEGLYTDCYAAGVLKVSPDRTKLACMNYSHTSASPSRAELYDFDPATGIVSNLRIINTHPGCYGAEFSPDGTKLYVWSTYFTLYQYDITGPDAASISATEYIVHSYPIGGGPAGGDLRLAPDGKIYCNGYLSHLDEISSPNLSGAACGYTPDVYDIAPSTGRWGVPNLFWGVMPPDISGVSALCIGDTTVLSSPAPGAAWSGGNPGVAAVSPSGTVTAISAGTATVTYSASCGMATTVVTVHPQPAAIGNDHIICIGSSDTLTSAAPGGTWVGSDITIATIDPVSGAISGVSPGTVTVTYRLGTGCFTTGVATVISCPLSASVQTKTTDLTIYPNPATDYLHLYVPSFSGVGRMTVSDVPGRVLLAQTINFVAGRGDGILTDLSPGTYLVTINAGPATYHRRICITSAK